jgi:uncharacterized protein (DUF433 family)
VEGFEEPGSIPRASANNPECKRISALDPLGAVPGAAPANGAGVPDRCAILCGMPAEQAFKRRPDICGGQPVIRGTRVHLRTVLATRAEGASVEEIVADFPTVSAEQVSAVIAFAAASAEEDLPVPGIPTLE